MKKLVLLMMILCLSASLFVGCGNNEPVAPAPGDVPTTEGTPNAEPMSYDKLVVYFVPSKEPEEIITATEPLKALLKDALIKEGYNFKDITIEVGTSYEAVGEALSAGTAHVGFIPGGTYVLYDDSAKVILTATRDGLNKDSDDPKDWNDGQPTLTTEDQVTYYRTLIIAGPSAKGQALSAKVNSGEGLTADDLKSANWGVRTSSSPSGYIYPALWLNEHFGLNITDLPNVVQTDSYGSSIARLASEQLDVIVAYADARIDYEDKWMSEYGRKASIWEETNLIGVTEGIYNDTISVTKNDDMMDDKLIQALQNAFISIAGTPEGKDIISVYSHNGYQIANDSDYDAERRAQELVCSMQ